MNRTSIVVTPTNYVSPLKVSGTEVTVLATKAATQGHVFTYQTGMPGNGAPPHSHPWDEAFFVVKGNLDFTCAGKVDHCPTGTLVFVPAGTVHTFTYGPDGGAMLECTGAGSLSVEFFTDMANNFPPEQVGATSSDVEKIKQVAGQTGCVFHF
jgi:quercetin dioxygenase-like cupin family protein